MALKKDAEKSTRSASAKSKFSAEERAAMKERAKEAKAGKDREAGEQDVLAKIAEMQEPDRSMAEKIHKIIKATAPDLMPRTWYGQPAYAKDGNIICFFQPAQKFKTRYATLGFSDKANLDEGSIWPNSYAVMEMTAAVEKKIVALLHQAMS